MDGVLLKQIFENLELVDLNTKVKEIGDEPWREKSIEFVKDICSYLTGKKSLLNNTKK